MTTNRLKTSIFFYFLSFYTVFLPNTKAQTYYFPPTTGTTWDTLSPASLGWCTQNIDSLYRFLERGNTKGFIVLKNGKIVLERYFGTFTRDSNWYWASAGKTLTAFAVGIAQQEGRLHIGDTTSKYIGVGWTSLPRIKEDKITIRHQLAMTTGLDDGVADSDCTLPSCLQYKADAGTRWAYHNAAYTLLDTVIEAATGTRLNAYVQTKIRSQIGMNGAFLKLGYLNVNFSTARSMARFGLLLLNKGKWNNNVLLTDTAYFRQMTTTSQNMNLSYGYLTWLNGKNSFMAPGFQTVFPGSMMRDAPADMYSALGKNGQVINIVPSQGLVVVRMGDTPDGTAVPIVFTNQVWQQLNRIICTTTATENTVNDAKMSIFPNPTEGVLQVRFSEAVQPISVQIVDITGRVFIQKNKDFNEIAVQDLATGFYFVKMQSIDNQIFVQKFIKK